MKMNESVDERKLECLEAESADMLKMLRERRDEENALLAVPDRVFSDSDDIFRPLRGSGKPTRTLRLSPAWLAAALVIGFVAGFTMPHGAGKQNAERSYTLVSDTVQGCSVACGDINTTLLVSL